MQLNQFSSRGPTADGRIKPEVVARGGNTAVVNPLSNNAYSTNSGTSFSAPLVAGAVAVLLSAHPHWTPIHVRQSLLTTASNHNQPNNEIGWGLINVQLAMQYNVTKKNETHIECNCTANGICIDGHCRCYEGFGGIRCEIARHGWWSFYGKLFLKLIFSLFVGQLS